jgi:hypothetical protein
MSAARSKFPWAVRSSSKLTGACVLQYGMTPMTSRLYTYESTGISEMDAESQKRKRL